MWVLFLINFFIVYIYIYIFIYLFLIFLLFGNYTWAKIKNSRLQQWHLDALPLHVYPQYESPCQTLIKKKAPKERERTKTKGQGKFKIHCLLDKVFNLMIWHQSQVKITSSRWEVDIMFICWQSNLSVEMNYPTTLAASILLILFSEMMSFSPKTNS